MKTTKSFPIILHFLETIIEGFTVETKMFTDYNCETVLAVAGIVRI